VKHIARIKVKSGDRAGGVGGDRLGALEWTCARTRNIDRGNSAVVSAHETVKHIARVRVPSRDYPVRVDAQWVGADRGRTWGIEGSKSALRVAREALIWNVQVRLGEEPFNRSCRVDAVNYGARAGSCARARSIDHGHGAVGSAHEAVRHIACAKVSSTITPAGLMGLPKGTKV